MPFEISSFEFALRGSKASDDFKQHPITSDIALPSVNVAFLPAILKAIPLALRSKVHLSDPQVLRAVVVPISQLKVGGKSIMLTFGISRHLRAIWLAGRQ